MAKPLTSVAPVNLPPHLQANRPVAPAPGGGSQQSENPSVEAISPQIAVTPRNSASNFRDFNREFTGEERRRPRLLSSTGPLDAPTETFVALFEQQNQNRESDVGTPPVLSSLRGLTGKLVEKAIGIYEQNIRLISGEQVERGSTLRITL